MTHHHITTYKGYDITKTRGFLTNKLRARNGDGDVHSRNTKKGDGHEQALEQLKRDIDEYGETTDE